VRSTGCFKRALIKVSFFNAVILFGYGGLKLL
jgi:hypothetical protein